MFFKAQENGIKVTREYFSKTLDQLFPGGQFKLKSPGGMLCIPHIQFSTDPNRKIVLLTMDWGFMLKDLV